MLSVVPTPIGNTEDITLRGLRYMREAEYFLCESTVQTKKLCNIYEISLKNKTFFSYNGHSASGQKEKYIALARDHHVLLLSDAGSPGLSDPGKEIISDCVYQRIPIEILPGANALIPAVVGAPFPTNTFRFAGYMPHKKGRQTLLQRCISSDIPVFFYESVHRVEKTLVQLSTLGYEGPVYICKEISKIHETRYFGTIESLQHEIVTGAFVMKGEFVLGLYSGYA